MPRSAYFVGKIALVAVVAVVQQVLLLAVGVAFYGLDLPTDAGRWLTYAWVCVLGTAACTLLGIAATAIVKNGKTAPAVISPIAIVLQFISGVFFVFTSLPGWMQNLASVFPLKWMCQGLRAVFLPESFGAREPGGSYDLGTVALMLGIWCVLALALCLTTFRWTTKRDG
jgi:ABC-2 type transport system permease protein